MSLCADGLLAPSGGRWLHVLLLAVALITLPPPSPAASIAEGEAAYRRKDFQSALKNWQPVAERGHPGALWRLGALYERGDGVERDPARAIVTYEQAADRGSANAMLSLAYHYTAGELVERDLGTAFVWRLRAAEAGHADGQLEAGVSLLYGRGVSPDVEQAVFWLDKAAEAGLDDARRELAAILIDEDSELYDPERAVELYELLAVKGHVDVQVFLGWMYKEGRHLPQDLSAARSWGARATTAGSLEGEMILASIAFDQDQNVENLRAYLRAAVRAAQDDAENPAQTQLYEDVLGLICALDSYQVENAADAALKREMLEEAASFLDGQRARGETPCP